MKKLLITLLAVSGFSFADGHGHSDMNDVYYAYYSLAANNPPAVVAAMDKFADSDCFEQQKAAAGQMASPYPTAQLVQLSQP